MRHVSLLGTFFLCVAGALIRECGARDHGRSAPRPLSGSFGEVYRAFDPTLQRHVALKLLLPRGAHPEAEAAELLREARALAKVRHPNIVAIYGVDRHDGRVGFWSDFVFGRTFSQIVDTQGPLGAREAALVGIDVCKAAAAVHAAGLLHRDIKAGNVMREAGGRILLMDFGLTHEGDRDDSPRGTPPTWRRNSSPDVRRRSPATSTQSACCYSF